MQTPKISTTLFFCVTFFTIFGQQRQDKFILDASLTGFKDGTKFYFYDIDATQNIDSAYLQNEKLRFIGHVSEPAIYRLKPEFAKVSFVLWMENKNITVSGDKNNFSDLHVEGSPLNKIFQSVQQNFSTLQKLQDSLTAKATNESDKLKRNEIVINIGDIDQKIFKIRLRTIATFHPSLVTLRELYYLRNDLTTDSLKILFNRFPTNLKKTKYGEVITQYILTDDLKVGAHATDIIGNDFLNKELKLSDYKNKVVLLDFWASWCAPCRDSNKKLKKLFQKYNQNGFEIISFSIDTDLDDWKNASEKDSITWINISDLKGLYSKHAASYKIRAIPKSFLIDKNGTIMQIFTGFDEKYEASLENKIQELMK
ncbi:MAG: TlpA disulfide reductase family protein [Agriterribacter sp.]